MRRKRRRKKKRRRRRKDIKEKTIKRTKKTCKIYGTPLSV
jgi:hypothetical protein